MRKYLILSAFILIMSVSSVFADMPAQKQPTPAKEEQKQGICFAPAAVAGVLFSLALIAFGLRFMRKREIRSKAEGIIE